jgi:hypothetical protein
MQFIKGKISTGNCCNNENLKPIEVCIKSKIAHLSLHDCYHHISGLVCLICELQNVRVSCTKFLILFISLMDLCFPLIFGNINLLPLHFQTIFLNFLYAV